MSCPLKPKWERRKQARPQELLAAALDLFVERGFAATRLDDVAKAAGVSKGTLYLYFSSKEELFKAVVRESVIPSIGRAEGMIDQFNGRTEDLFRQVATSWWQEIGMTKLSGLPKLMMAEVGNFPDLASFYQEEVVNRGEKLMASILARGMAQGEIRPLDLEIDTRLMTAPMLMMMMWKHSSGICQVEEHKLPTYLEHYIEMVLHSILIKKPDQPPVLAE